MNEAEVIAELLNEGRDDWVPLHDVVWYATKGVLTEETKGNVLGVLGTLFAGGLMVPGDLDEAGFVDWQGSAVDFLARSSAELERLDWRPMGDGFWLRLTNQGANAVSGRPS